MTLVPTAQIVDAARRHRGAVAALNVITLEHAEAIAAAAVARDTAVIIQVSENAVRYHGGALEPIALACAAIARQAPVPIGLHLDHVTEIGLLERACALPFGSVMYDAGAAPYDDNVAQTRRAVDLGHRSGMWVEAELGHVGGKAGTPKSAHAAGVRTDPDEAAAYVRATGVDALAVAVGTVHAMTTRTARLDTDLIASLRAAVPVPLVLHGSSGVAYDELRAAVAAGIAKVNVGTALNVAMTTTLRTELGDPDVVDPRGYLRPARVAMAATVQELLAALT